jgi:circadian clock protein KaiC
MMCVFDEREQTLLARSRAMGLALEPYLDSGRLQLLQIDPGELTPSEFSHVLRRAVEHDNVSMVVIDSISGYLQAMSEERFLLLYLHELLQYLGQQGVLTLPIVIQQGLLGPQMKSPIEISYLADSVLLFRHFEYAGEMRQALSVYKHRSSYHERAIRELRMEPGKLVIGEPLKMFQGIMTGVPQYTGDAKQLDEQV